MKAIIHYSLLLLCFCSSFIIYGQDSNNSLEPREVKNEISFELLQIVNGVYQFSYERHIWNNFSGLLAFGIKGKEGLVELSGIDREQIKTGDVFYTGFQIAPEIRYYIKGTNKFDQKLNGFYLGLYYKYHSYTSELTGTYIDQTSSGDVNYDLAFDMDLDISSVGLMIGYKLAITKRFNIDFLIAGPGSGNYNFQIKNKKDLPESFYDDLNEALENYNLLDFINGDFRFSEVNTKSNFSAFSFRYGIAIGYTF